MKNLILMCCAFLLLYGCAESEDIVQVDCGQTENIDTSSLKGTINEQIQYGELTTYLDSHLWVNRMPQIIDSNEPKKSCRGSFIANVNLHSLAGLKPDSNISKINLYILENGNALWKAGIDGEINVLPEDAIEMAFLRGPGSLEGKIVDLVLTFEYESETFRIKQEGLFVESVW